jgi:hypothetical protein
VTIKAIRGEKTFVTPDTGTGGGAFEGAFGYCGAGQSIASGGTTNQLLLPTVRYDTNLAGGGPGIWNGGGSYGTFRSDGYYLLVVTAYVRLNSGAAGASGDDFVGFFTFGTPANHNVDVNHELNMAGFNHFRTTWSFVDRFLTGEVFQVWVENGTSFTATVQMASVSISKLGS